MRSYEVYLRDTELKKQEQLDPIEGLMVCKRFNEVSTWEVTLASDVTVDRRMGIEIYRDGLLVVSGPLSDIQTSCETGYKKITLHGKSNLGYLEERLALSDPNGPPYTSQGYDIRSGPAESVIKGYVQANVGALATAVRRIAMITVATDYGRGNAVSAKARFEPLLPLIKEIAAAGLGEHGLGFEIVKRGEALVFDVYVPRDKSGEVVFSEELGNVEAYSFTDTVPASNYLYVGGGYELEQRAIVEGGDYESMVAWGRRIEQFEDQRAFSNSTELKQWLSNGLRKQAGGSVWVRPVETETLRYGKDYDAGDIVKVVIGERAITGLVREVTIEAGGDGEMITVAIGGDDYAGVGLLSGLYGQLGELDARVKRLEVR